MPAALIAFRYHAPGGHAHGARLRHLDYFFNATRHRPDGTLAGDMRHYAGEVLDTLLRIVYLHACGHV